MKYAKQKVLLLLIVSYSLLGANNKESIIGIVDEVEEHQFPSQPEIPQIPRTPREKSLDQLGIDSRLYLERLSKLETGGVLRPYQIVNRFGYMGKYQFGQKTLNRLHDLGYIQKTYKYHFLNSPALQEKAIDALIRHNVKVLQRYGLISYVGKEIRGVTITLEGMLAGAHLVGPKAVKDFIKHGKISRDGNGTKITKYLKAFE